MIILAFDALDLDQVQRFNCSNLIQKEYGQTDLKDFEKLRTIVLWASFLTGRNMEKDIPIQTQWQYKLKPEETFTAFFKTYAAIDVPAFSFKQKNHTKVRKLLKGYFDQKASIEEYDACIWQNHEENKNDFFDAIGNFDLVMAYFDLADAIGHLSFGITEKMSEVYKELDNIAEKTKELNDQVLIISDHGMKTVGRYGDHSRKGFYSLNHKLGIKRSKITDFYDHIRRITENEQPKDKPGSNRA